MSEPNTPNNQNGSDEQKPSQPNGSQSVTEAEVISEITPSAGPIKRLWEAVINMQRALLRQLLPVWKLCQPPLLKVMGAVLVVANWLRQSGLGRAVGTFLQWIATTLPGQIFIQQSCRAVGAIKGKWHHWKGLYIKLTSPPPDPLMAAMMMQNEPIDLDQDDIRLTGNKVFVYITAFFTVFVLWASFAKLDESVRAEGSMVTPSSVQLVQNRLPGSVVTIEVKLGEHVEKGQVLFKLEDEDVIANFDDNEITRLVSLAMKARLTAEVDGLDQVMFPPWLEKAAPQVIRSEIEVFERRRKALETRLVSLRRRIANFEDKINILKPLVEAGHEARLTLVDVEGQYHAALDEYQAVIAEFRSESASQLAEVNKQADQAGAREDAFRAKVAHAEVRASTSGIISAVHIKTVGAVVQAGTVLAEIVPDEKAILVMARLPAEDVADVYPGQIAQVSLSAYDVSRHGTLEGYVQKIAQNTTQEENLPPYYQTMIEINNPRFSKSEEEVEIVPGSPVMVDIIGNKRTIMSYILTPLERAAGRAFREK